MLKTKRLLALSLALIFLLSAVPFQAFSLETPPVSTNPGGGNTNSGSTVTIDGFKYTLKRNPESATVVSCSLTDEEIEVPSIVVKDGIAYSVTAIGDSAFAGNTTVTGLYLPESVISIGKAAFDGCTALSVFECGESVSSVGRNAFRGTSWLNEFGNGPVVIGKVYYQYMGTCPEKVIIPSSVSAISEGAFYNSATLLSLVIPETVTSIPDNALIDCSDDLVIYGSVGSAAEEFSKLHYYVFVKIPYIEIVSLPQQSYVVGQELDVSDGIICYVDAFGNVDQSLSMSDDMISGFDSSIPGNFTLTVTHGGAEAFYNISIFEKRLTSIVMENLPDKTSYFLGDTLDLTGATIALHYNDESVEEGIAVTPEMVSVTELDEYGSIRIIVSYDGQETGFMVTVTEIEVDGIEWITKPTTDVFLEGSPLDASGGKIRVFYNNNTSSEVDLTASMILGYNALTLGEQLLTVVYGGYELTYSVTVKAKVISGIEILTLPTKLTYSVGESLFVAGGKLQVCYDNGTHEELALRSSMVSGFQSDAEGLYTLTVTYEGFTANFEVQVISYVKGDLNYDGISDRNDAIYLLYYLFVPEKYPVYQNVDFNNDSVVSDRDVFVVLSGDYPETGGSGAIIPPSGGTDAPPVGDTPVGYSLRTASAPVSLEAPAELVKGENGEFTVKLDQGVTFTSAFVKITVGQNVQLVSAQWLINGDLSDYNADERFGALAVENAAPVSGGVFRFTVKSDVLSASEEIGVSVVLMDAAAQIVGTADVTVTVPVAESSVSFIYGDLNADGIVDSLDGLLLLRDLNGWQQEIASPEAMDVSGDGFVDSLDGLILLRYLNGWDVSLGGN